MPEDVGTCALAGLEVTFGGQTSIVVLTAESVGGISEVHSRMPLFVQGGHFDEWLGAGPSFERVLAKSVELGLELEFWPVSKQVNRASNDSCELICPVELSAEARRGEAGKGQFSFSEPDLTLF